ncbi:hypothetical protein NQZ68_025888 [Dissostichus eleginoides]|nr:hypothetical protein NQZ68_025888 [Dissostichus eleginoides]
MPISLRSGGRVIAGGEIPEEALAGVCLPRLWSQTPLPPLTPHPEAGEQLTSAAPSFMRSFDSFMH